MTQHKSEARKPVLSTVGFRRSHFCQFCKFEFLPFERRAKFPLACPRNPIGRVAATISTTNYQVV